MNERDSSRLRDMLREAQQAQKFAQGKSLVDLYQDDVLSYAIVRAPRNCWRSRLKGNFGYPNGQSPYPLAENRGDAQ